MATTPPSLRSPPPLPPAARDARPLAGFGSRLSGALMALPGASPSAAEAAADGLARDVTLFEQRGCLSAHHVFVAGGAGEACGFAARLARALARLERRLPAPARPPLGACHRDSCAARARAMARARAAHGWRGRSLRWRP